ncbi:MAG: orc1/cdc6 family replication initiation protein [Methanobrevibacter sp.]|nr:orc1/cdc6 family replication initiation protein [Methanobrevibacter sp.]
MDLTTEFPDSPFEPGHPVSPDKFKGRKNDIIKIIRYLPRVINKGTPEHFFITGKRGMGKTSFVKYIGSLAEDNYQMVHIYVNNEGTNTIDELIQNLVEKMFKEFNKETWGQKIISSFVDNIDEINIKGFGISLKNKPELVANIKNNFTDFIINTCKELKDKKGIFIVIDDINGLSDTPEFANWYKGLFETMDFDEEFIPVSFTLVSYQDKFEQLCDQNPSFSRIFNLIEIGHLDDEDIKEFRYI